MNIIDWQAVGNAAGSLAGFAIIGKWLMRGVERSNAMLPAISESLTTINQGLKELFESRNDHSRRIERVETIQDIRGCNEPIRRRSTDTTHE
ncbi:hypothetical protein F6V30_13930 [Oryzomonas sagensis]|uniref:Uncharacterized protein n=1 Tax=Oryzomonas sagensis TaxID=2603857 RepID=A0ABQ6TKY3_9BACT|nr:hypothetical protein [Oryzomonas sagensis]KAB0668932.1 hypothetical protein F6V30_13930 [Oryzomonas sagensis]